MVVCKHVDGRETTLAGIVARHFTPKKCFYHYAVITRIIDGTVNNALLEKSNLYVAKKYY